MTDFQIVLCTCAGREQAERIARRLAELHLASSWSPRLRTVRGLIWRGLTRA